MKVKKKTLIREEFRRRGQWLDGECCRMTEGRIRKMKKTVWQRGEGTPCCEKVFVSVDVWTEAGQWNVGMKFWNEGTMKKGWVGAARVGKVETKVMVKMRDGAGIRRLGTGTEARQKDKLE